MVRANKRNEALRIESALLNKIAMLGTEKTAEAVGVDKSQISRWKRDWIPKFSMLLAVLEWGSLTTTSSFFFFFINCFKATCVLKLLLC